MSELPEYFWVRMTSTVVLALLALMPTAALLAWTVGAVEDLWQGIARAGFRVACRHRPSAEPLD